MAGRRLDAILPRGARIGLLKIDAEGHEELVLRGLGALPAPRAVFLELCRPCMLAKQLDPAGPLRLLRARGYRLFASAACPRSSSPARLLHTHSEPSTQ